MRYILDMLVYTNIVYITGFDNYHKIVVRDYVHVAKIWCT